MKKHSIEKINKETKDAWVENWESMDINTILEIFDYPRVKKFFEVIKSYLPEEGTILEGGCGLGPWVIKLNELGYDVVGIDYQEESVNRIKEYDSSQKVQVADVTNIPFNDNSFSAYLSWGVIEHFAEGPDAALEEAYRVLVPGGRLILTVPFKNIFRRISEPLNSVKRSQAIRKTFNKPAKAYYYQKYFKIKELKKTISGKGFHIEKLAPVDHIFSLVEFSNMFREKNTLDGENDLAVKWGLFLERYLPWLGAGSTLIIAKK